jgi:hypothetical protein
MRYIYAQVNAQHHYSMVCTIFFSLISPGFVLLKKMYFLDEVIAINFHSLDDKPIQFYRIVILSFHTRRADTDDNI